MPDPKDKPVDTLIRRLEGVIEYFAREFPDMRSLDVIAALEFVKLNYFNMMPENGDDGDDDDEKPDLPTVPQGRQTT